MYKYFRYTYLPILFTPLTIIGILATGYWPIVVICFVNLFHLIYDNAFKPDQEVPNIQYPAILNLYLFMQLPTSIFCLFVLLWQCTPGDLLNFGAFAKAVTNIDIISNHQSISLNQKLIAALAVGYNLSANTVVAHELVHRTQSYFSVLIGRILLALVGDAQFSISHVYAHHANVATEKDAATARRGENVYAFAIRSAIGQYKESWSFEKRRLLKNKKTLFSLSNRVISGALLTFVFVVIFYFYSGLSGVAAYTVVLLTTKFLFEVVNYIEHYGLIRVEKSAIHPRHSWDSMNKGTSYVLYNLSRHADHHANARKPYWKLESSEDCMQLEYGYVAHITLAMLPFFWFKYTSPRLKYWDENFATSEERKLVEKYNNA